MQTIYKVNSQEMNVEKRTSKVQTEEVVLVSNVATSAVDVKALLSTVSPAKKIVEQAPTISFNTYQTL